jgi:polygalacturonase
MKRVFSILLALALVLTFSLAATTPVAADSGYRMVDDDGKGWVDIDTGAHDCDSTAMNVVTTIQAGIDATPDGGTLFVCPGTYGAFTVDGRTGLTIKAASAVTVQGVQVVATAYTNRDCVAFVKDSTNIVLDGLTIGPNTGKTQQKDYGIIRKLER